MEKMKIVKKNNKKSTWSDVSSFHRKVIISTLIIGIISIASGVSYALWNKTYRQKDPNTIRTECFKVQMINETEGINIENALPVSDEEGKSYDGYAFTIKNVCNKPAYYQVNLEELIEEKKLPNKYMKISINNSEGKKLDTYKEVETTIDNADKSHKLTSGALRANEEITYNLKMWIAEDTPPVQEVMSAIFKSKVSVIATYKEEVDLENNVETEVISKNEEISREKEVITINVKSDEYDIIEYSPDGVNYYPVEPGKNVNIDVTLTDEGRHIIYVKDEVGNIKEVEVETTKLDQTAPNIEITEEDKQETIELTISFSDEKSGLFGYKITESNIEPTEWDSFDGVTRTSTESNKIKFTINKNTTYYIWVKDKIGNVGYKAYSASTIDTTPPGLEVTNTLTNYGLSDTIRISAHDDVIGLSGVSFTKAEGEYHWEAIEGSPLEYSKTVDVDENGTYYISVKDAYDHVTTKSVVIDKIDRMSPVIESVTGNPITWTNQTVTLTVNASDSASGLHNDAYSFDNGITWQSENTKIYSENTNNIIIKVRDSLGNTNIHEAINITKIDKDSPTITGVSGNPTTWTNQSVTLTINGANDTRSGLHSSSYSFDNGASWQSENTKTYNTNTNNIIIKVRDSLGNIYTHEAINITKIDKDIPNITGVSGNPTTWTNQDVTLTVNGASDTGSGLHASSYSFDNGASWQSENTKTYSENTNGIIIKVRDNLGNIYTHEAINITKIDKSVPINSFSVASSTAGTNSWYKDLSIKVSFLDSLSGIASSKYCITTSSTCTPNTTASISNNSYTIALDSNASAQKICVQTTNNTNNTSDIQCSSAYKTDTTNPSQSFTIASSTAGTNSWYTALTVKVSVSDSHSGVASAKYCVTTSNTCTPETSATISSNTFNVALGTNSSVQKVCTQVTDNAGRISSVTCSNTYKVDTTNPIAKINTSQEEKSVTLSAAGSSDSGSGIATYYYSKDGGSTWQSSTTSIYTFSGLSYKEYTFAIKVVDASGRTSSVVTAKATPLVKLYSTITTSAVLDNVSSEFVTSPTGIDFGVAASDTNGKGIYIMSSTKNNSYPIHYFRGVVTNNNVKFANFCWLIVRTTETGGIKLIYNGTVDTNGGCSNGQERSATIGVGKFNENNGSTAYAGYMYPEANTNNSTIKSIIDNWYKNNMTGHTKYLEDTVWCNDRSIYKTSSGLITYMAYQRISFYNKPSIECSNEGDRFTVNTSNGNGKLMYPVALLTVDEANFGGSISVYKGNSYLTINQKWWLLSPATYVSATNGSTIIMHCIDSNGSVITESVDTYLEGYDDYSTFVRPSVSLTSGILINVGDGSPTNPYTIYEN